MSAERHVLPRTKLWREADSFVIVLECECGAAVEYPGHPDDRATVVCDGCGQQWAVKS